MKSRQKQAIKALRKSSRKLPGASKSATRRRVRSYRKYKWRKDALIRKTRGGKGKKK